MSIFVSYISFIIALIQGYHCKFDPMEIVNYDVYTGRHFNDLVTSSKVEHRDTVMTSTILMLYSPPCADDMKELLLKHITRLPGPHALTIAKHDYKTFPQHIWYSFDHTDSLRDRYMTQCDPCLKILFWSAGEKLSDYQVIPPELDLASFVWSKFFTSKEIINKLDEPIDVHVGFNQNSVLNVTVYSGQREPLPMFMSMPVVVFREDLFIYGELISTDPTAKELVINQDKIQTFNELYKQRDGSSMDADTWATVMNHTKKTLDREENHWRQALKTMYLCTFKFPKYLPKLTHSGFTIETASLDVLAQLKQYIESLGSTNMTLERGKYSREPVLNNGMTLTSMVKIHPSVRKSVLRKVVPAVETFAGISMNLSSAILRIYDPDTVIRDHIDIKNGHVINVLLALGEVDEDNKLLTDPDFFMEVALLDFTGRRKIYKLKQGEMLIYESKSIILSKRKVQDSTFKYAAGHFHFKPKENWPWKFVSEGDHMVLTDNDKVKIVVDQLVNHKVEPVKEGEGQRKPRLKLNIINSVKKDPSRKTEL